MNSFKDQNGCKWLSTKAVAKMFRVPAPTFHNWKANGRLERGVHWIQDSLPPKYIYWNPEIMREWIVENYPGCYAIPSKPEEKKPIETKQKKAGPVLVATIQLTPQASELVTLIKETYKVETQESINNVVVSRKTREASTGIICNMLLVKGAQAYLDESAL